MTRYALLNNVEHQDLKVITERGLQYGDQVQSCVTFPFEFRTVQSSFPILLQQDEIGALYPVALFGFQEGENLFLNESGWQANYVPAMLRREPFLIGFQDAGQEDKRRMLSIDLDHPRISKAEGEPLFQPLGGRTPYLENMADLLETIYRGYEHARTFMEALKEHDLTESITFEIVLKDGSSNQLLGYHGLIEEKVQALDGATLQSFNEQGFLMPMFMMLASTPNIQTLVDAKNRELD